MERASGLNLVLYPGTCEENRKMISCYFAYNLFISQLLPFVSSILQFHRHHWNRHTKNANFHY